MKRSLAFCEEDCATDGVTKSGEACDVGKANKLSALSQQTAEGEAFRHQNSNRYSLNSEMDQGGLWRLLYYLTPAGNQSEPEKPPNIRHFFPAVIHTNINKAFQDNSPKGRHLPPEAAPAWSGQFPP